ncbi:MAG: protein kinase, partial [Deltaproteobacteria bacterium]|nr:protein kinase [Deltaproteobacteria bacterium]
MAETVPYHGERATTPDSPPTSDEAASRATAFDETMPNVREDGKVGEGAKVGRYDILERVGSGGMGVVFRARDPELRREVAVKLLKAERATGQAAVKRRKRLLREARAMAQLSHPNVIPVYDVGEYGNGLYVAMEYVVGANARQWLKSVRPPWRRTLGVFRAAGRGLAAAHNAGLVHRDFKPANVLVGDDGRVRVLDFGLARALVDEPEPDLEVSGPIPDEPETGAHWSETLTADGTILGTPVYMAPEQYAGKIADARSDQYSFCIALYEALFEQLPFPRGSIKQQARAKYKGEIREPASESPVPRRLYYVLRRGLAPHPEDRFASMPALLRELRAVNEDPPRRPAWRTWVPVAAVAGVTLVLLLIAGLTREPAVAAAPECTPAAEALAGAWDPSVRQQTQQAFIDSSVAGADARFEEVASRLDARATQWGQLWDETCPSTTAVDARTLRLQTARRTCLSRHRGQLQAFVETLVQPSAVVVHRAASAAHGLPAMEDCEDVTALLAAADRDEGQRDRVTALLEQVGRARALRTTGRPDGARRAIDAVVESAGAEDLRPVTGLALIERAHLSRSTHDLEAAEHDLRAAYF